MNTPQRNPIDPDVFRVRHDYGEATTSKAARTIIEQILDDARSKGANTPRVREEMAEMMKANRKRSKVRYR